MGRENKFLRWIGQAFNGSQMVALSFMLLIWPARFVYAANFHAGQAGPCFS